jgi:hypothetical protein
MDDSGLITKQAGLGFRIKMIKEKTPPHWWGHPVTLVVVGIVAAVVATWIAQSPSVPPVVGNNNYNQQGGINNQIYINQSTTRLKLTPAIKSELLARLPKDKLISLEVIGSDLPVSFSSTRS